MIRPVLCCLSIFVLCSLKSKNTVKIHQKRMFFLSESNGDKSSTLFLNKAKRSLPNLAGCFLAKYLGFLVFR